MWFLFLFIISILSLFSVSNKIWEFIIKYRVYLSNILLILSFATLFLIFSPFSIKESWENALSLLWIILWLPILSKVFWLSIAQKLMWFRKELWIWMWSMAFVHGAKYFLWDYSTAMWSMDFWFYNGTITYLAFGMIALILTIVLTITSNIFSMKMLWKKWKTLHRIVYFLLIFILLHVAFLKKWAHWNIAIITTFIPFIIYFVWKILEWKNIKLPLQKK